MNRERFFRLLAPLVLVAGLSFSACGGESERIDDASAGDAGEPSDTGGTSTGGRGGTSTGGRGGTSTGGRGGTPSTGGSSTGGTGGIDGMCDEIVPCGGDPEGTWSVRENCLEVLVTDIQEFLQYPACRGVVGRASGDVEGTFTFADGIMTQDIVVTAFVTVTINDECAQGIVGSPDITAADLCPLLDAQFMSDPETPGSCAPTSEGCQCDAMQAPMPSTNMGAYTVVGDQLVAEDGTSFDFCQEGDELHLHGYPADAQTGQVAGLTVLLDRI